MVDTEKEIERLERLVKKRRKIEHLGFGTGTITKVDNKKSRFRVKFEVGEKRFMFPDTFIRVI